MPRIINSQTTLSQINIASQKAKLIATYRAVVEGIDAELGDTTSFVINGVTYSKPEIAAEFQARIDAAKRTIGARTALHAAVVDERTADARAAALHDGFKSYLKGRYGKTSPELQKYGYAPQKVPQRAAATKANAVKMNELTRKARGTIGKKAKSLIKGVAGPAAPAAGGPTTAAPTTR